MHHLHDIYMACHVFMLLVPCYVCGQLTMMGQQQIEFRDMNRGEIILISIFNNKQYYLNPLKMPGSRPLVYNLLQNSIVYVLGTTPPTSMIRVLVIATNVGFTMMMMLLELSHTIQNHITIQIERNQE